MCPYLQFYTICTSLFLGSCLLLWVSRRLGYVKCWGIRSAAHVPGGLQGVVVAGHGIRDEVGVAVRVDDANGRDPGLGTVDYGKVVVVL